MTASRAVLRPYVSSDFGCLSEIRNNAELQSQLLNVATHQSDDQVQAWIDRRSNDPTGRFLVVADSNTDQCRGFVQIVDINRAISSGRFGIAIHPQFHGQGYGADATRSMLNEAQQLGLQQVQLVVRKDNAPARRVYERLGFKTIAQELKSVDDQLPPVETLIMSITIEART